MESIDVMVTYLLLLCMIVDGWYLHMQLPQMNIVTYSKNCEKIESKPHVYQMWHVAQ